MDKTLKLLKNNPNNKHDKITKLPSINVQKLIIKNLQLNTLFNFKTLLYKFLFSIYTIKYFIISTTN